MFYETGLKVTHTWLKEFVNNREMVEKWWKYIKIRDQQLKQLAERG